MGGAVGVAAIGVIFYGSLGSGSRNAYPHAFGAGLIYLMAIAVTVECLVQMLAATQPLRMTEERKQAA